MMWANFVVGEVRSEGSARWRLASHPSWLFTLLSQGGRPAKFSVCRAVRSLGERSVSSYFSLPSLVFLCGSGRGSCVLFSHWLHDQPLRIVGTPLVWGLV